MNYLPWLLQNRQELLIQLEKINTFLNTSPHVPLKDLAFNVNKYTEQQKERTVKAAIVASSIVDLQNKIQQLENICSGNMPTAQDNAVYFQNMDNNENISAGKLVFVLPGLGSAYPGMLIDLCLHFSRNPDYF